METGTAEESPSAALRASRKRGSAAGIKQRTGALSRGAVAGGTPRRVADSETTEFQFTLKQVNRNSARGQRVSQLSGTSGNSLFAT
jgi:hypothetical protein